MRKTNQVNTPRPRAKKSSPKTNAAELARVRVTTGLRAGVLDDHGSGWGGT